jgi:hypothetical protein
VTAALKETQEVTMASVEIYILMLSGERDMENSKKTYKKE